MRVYRDGVMDKDGKVFGFGWVVMLIKREWEVVYGVLEGIVGWSFWEVVRK